MNSIQTRSGTAFALLLTAGTLLGTATRVEAHTPSADSAAASVGPLDVCPVDGDNDFINSWGDARSGGRSHIGVDLIADRGVPVIAVRDGDAHFKRSNLGGNAIWLTAADGERFYYAHLSDWEGSSRAVQAGEVIGYVGSSGNARGNHLHFETHSVDGPINPYPLVEFGCAEPPADTESEPLIRDPWMWNGISGDPSALALRSESD